MVNVLISASFFEPYKNNVPRTDALGDRGAGDNRSLHLASCHEGDRGANHPISFNQSKRDKLYTERITRAVSTNQNVINCTPIQSPEQFQPIRTKAANQPEQFQQIRTRAANHPSSFNQSERDIYRAKSLKSSCHFGAQAKA